MDRDVGDESSLQMGVGSSNVHSGTGNESSTSGAGKHTSLSDDSTDLLDTSTDSPIPNFHRHSKLLFDLFDQSMHMLHNMHLTIKQDEAVIKKQTQSKLKDQKSTMGRLQDDLEAINSEFRALEEYMNQVGNTTVQIGATLEQLDSQKKKATDAKQLLSYFTEFNRYDPDKFRREILSGRKDLRYEVFHDSSRQSEAAKILKQLNAVVPDLKGIAECERGVLNIAAYRKFLLDRLLRRFSSALQDEIDREVVSQLAVRAQILADFDAIEECMEFYVSRRFDLFLGIEEREYEPLKEGSGGKGSFDRDELSATSLLSPDDDQSNPMSPLARGAVAPTFDSDDSDEDDKSRDDSEASSSVQAHGDQDESHGSQNASTGTAQQNPDKLSNEDLDKIVQDKKEAKRAREKHLDNLRGERIKEMTVKIRSVAALKQLLESIEKTLLDEVDIMRRVFPNTTAEVAASFMKTYSKLLKSFLNGDWMQSPGAISQYLSYLKNLDQVHTLITEFMERILASDLPLNEENTRQLFDQLFYEKKLVYSQIENRYLSNLSEVTLTEIKLRAENESFQMDSRNPKKHNARFFLASTSQGVVFGHTDTELELHVVVKVLHENVASLHRCKKLQDPKDVPHCAKEIFEGFISFIRRYVTEGIITGQRKMNSERLGGASSPPSHDLFEMILNANTILQNVQRHLEMEVTPLVSTNIQASNECIQIKDDLFTDLETRVVSILQEACSSIVAHAEHLLISKQKKIDFFPRENQNVDASTMDSDNACTNACVSWCNFISDQLNSIDTALFGPNRDNFLAVVGSKLYKSLIRHMTTRCGAISIAGSVRFIRDMNQYYQCVGKFQVESVDRQFKVLTSIGKIMLMQPEHLGEILEEKFDLTQISKSDLMSLLRLRPDFKNSKIDKLKYFQGVVSKV